MRKVAVFGAVLGCMATPSAMAEVISSGTGFIVSPQGHILTNHHVITYEKGDSTRKCSRLDVVHGEDKRQASIVGDEPTHDLAVLKLSKPFPNAGGAPDSGRGGVDDDLLSSSGRRGGTAASSSDDGDLLSGGRGGKAAKASASAGGGTSVAVFNSEPVRAGQTVVAVGYPFSNHLAAQMKVVTGVVSSTAGIGNDVSNFQHSAPINPGNSGGPALDSSGLLIGINVAGYNTTIDMIGKPIPLPTVVKEQLAALGIPPNVTHSQLDTGRIPQNVNFAIKGMMAMEFLGSLNVPYSKAKAEDDLKTEEVYRRANDFTVQIFCHK